MKRIFCLFLVSASLSGMAQSHRDHDDKPRKEHDKMTMMKFIPSMTRTIGGNYQQFSGLKGRVANLPQYQQLKDYAATLGLGWFQEHDHFISQAGLTVGSTMTGKRDQKSSTVRSISVNADLGYDLLNSDKVSFYPLIGIGFQKYQAIFYRDNTGVDFNTVLQSPVVQNSISSVRFNNGFFVYRAGLGFALKSPKYPGNSIGLQAGYTGSFKKNDWKSNEGQSLANAPEDRISQFFVSLVFTNKPWFMHEKK